MLEYQWNTLKICLFSQTTNQPTLLPYMKNLPINLTLLSFIKKSAKLFYKKLFCAALLCSCDENP